MSEAPQRRARATDVARAAGVSTATVDRVLNRRPGVRDVTVQRVLEAAARLAYLPEDGPFAALAAKPLRLTFLLPAGTNRYLRMLGETVGYMEDQLAPLNVRCRAHTIEGFDPRVLAERLLHHGRRSDGVALMPLEHPLVREAVHTLAEEGVPVVTLVSDLSNSRRAGYVGLDNRAAGRTAALLLGRFIGARAATVGLIAGSRSYRGHEEREMGFLSLVEEMFPQLQVAGLREGQDDAATNERQTLALLEQHPQLAGIYNIGGASDGVARALKLAGREQKVVFIGHGLTPDTRALLIDGTLDAVITQSPQSVVGNAVRIFANLRDGRDALAGVETLRLSIVLRENLP
ncbi:MAG: LacI family DNA-binding transcriptional regulator [Piscinibacter sp.]|uniref:LacI family DNA-binding transcriptional regulator n=1 Tax=Piscinibacter sp. TaxID=1903157 RepID=UPI001B66C9F4|nr:LacI family DNA-binding transcriptional regulator [Piscinibacter sp.]MBP5990009.1 LacI family DNA-binding transcriptional regulator [Piscinibacter sp.]MBP6026606.1 LacI family DNA-binding transcriptional regulator [Piscinibacter sp.]